MSDALSLLQVLQVHRRGALLEHAEEQYRALAEAILEHGGTGDITIKIPLKRNKGGQIEITPKVTIKKPEKTLGTGIYYLTPEGRLSQRDPDQFDIEDDFSARRAAQSATQTED